MLLTGAVQYKNSYAVCSRNIAY